MVNVARIYSTLGNPDSLIPLAVKDLSATAGMTAGSFVTGKEEGQDRFIDEMGTEVIWLLGIPAFKKLFDLTVFKTLGLDAEFDARNLKDKDLLGKIKKYAPNKNVKDEIEKISKNAKTFKNASMAKFVVSTALTIGSYIGLTRFKQKYTEQKIKNNLISEYNAKAEKEKEDKKGSSVSNKPSFKGLASTLESYAFNPVKNMWILDGCITGERLKDSRSPQEFFGYSIKEAFTLFFMYYAGKAIQDKLEQKAVAEHNKSIGLDARVLEDDFLKKLFKDGSIQKSLDEFTQANKSKVELYEFLHKNPENAIVKASKLSDIIKLYKETDKIDTRKFINLDNVENVAKKIEELYKQYKEALSKGEDIDKFFASVKELKRTSILTNIFACILALGVVTPGVMLFKRFTSGGDEEFQTKKEIREQLEKEGIIA